MQTTKDLLNDQTATSVVEQFVGNTKFFNECVSKVKAIVEDDKLDFHDLPNILLLLVMVLNNSPNLKVNKQNMKQVLKLLLVRLLGEVGFVDLKSDNPLSDEQEMFIDSGLQLLGTYVKVNGCLYTVKNKVFGCLCHDDTDELQQHLDKQKETRRNVKSSKDNNSLENTKE